MRGSGVTGVFTVAGKELTQLANRLRFHFEKGLFVCLVTGGFIVAAATSIEGSVTQQELAAFGRGVFYSVTIGACLVLSAFALLASSGIITSEKTGRRLDVLRITPLSLAMIVLGKGLAIAVKSVLVLGLVAPVLAATQFFGGVGFGELAKASLIIVAQIAACTGIGLFVSAGARTNLDRVVRSAEIMIIWLVFTTLCVGVARVSGIAGIGAVSPIAIWDDLISAGVGWPGVILGACASFGVGAGLAALSVPTLAKAIEKDETATPSEPKLKSLAFGLGRLAGARRSIRQSTYGRVRAGSLLGNELKQSSLFLVLLPLAVCVPPLVTFAGFAIVGAGNDRNATAVVAMWTVVLTWLVITLQSSGSIARDKERHTAEILATTPAGGPGMLRWKGGAVFISQALAIFISILLLVRLAPARTYPPVVVVRLALFLSTTVLFWALGTSFSMLVRTPMAAGALCLMCLFTAAPFAGEWLRELSGDYGFMRPSILPGVGNDTLAVMGVGSVSIVVLLVRHRLGPLAAAALFVGASAALGSGFALLSVQGTRSGYSHLRSVFDMLGYVLRDYNFDIGTAARIFVFEAALAALLVIGMLPRFTHRYVRGARQKD